MIEPAIQVVALLPLVMVSPIRTRHRMIVPSRRQMIILWLIRHQRRLMLDTREGETWKRRSVYLKLETLSSRNLNELMMIAARQARHSWVR